MTKKFIYIKTNKTKTAVLTLDVFAMRMIRLWQFFESIFGECVSAARRSIFSLMIYNRTRSRYYEGNGMMSSEKEEERIERKKGRDKSDGAREKKKSTRDKKKEKEKREARNLTL